MSRIGISLGDPAGIGYEITAKALLTARVPLDKVLLIGNKDAFFKTVDRYKLDKDHLKKAEFHDVEFDGFDFDTMMFGVAQRPAGVIAVRTVESAVKLAMKGEISGLCTAPIHRDALTLAGSSFIETSAMIIALTASTNVTTVYELQKLRTLFLSRHVSLADALKKVTRQNIMEYIKHCDNTLRLLGSTSRKIAVAALNPHGGDGGLTGDTEEVVIKPAIEEASRNLQVFGPVPADVVYLEAIKGTYDIVLSLYHDQAHIALKALDFYRTIDMNIGLPFLRVSVDHGPGYDRAGKGTGIETNMVVAIQRTLESSETYRKVWAEIRSR